MAISASGEFPPELMGVVEALVPGIVLSSIELIGTGISTSAFRVSGSSGSWVVRVSESYPQPWTWHGGRGFEASLMRGLAGKGLPVALETRAISWAGPGLPSAFIELVVDGRPASAADVADSSLAAQLGTFLSGLHEVPTHWCRSIGVRPGFYLADLEDRIGDAAPRLRSGERRSARDCLEELYDSRPADVVLVHGDFRPDHWYVDDDGRVTGVIDFGDSALDDPALDFSRLPDDPGFAELVADRYAGNKHGLLRRADLYRSLERLVGRRDDTP